MSERSEDEIGPSEPGAMLDWTRRRRALVFTARHVALLLGLAGWSAAVDVCVAAASPPPHSSEATLGVGEPGEGGAPRFRWRRGDATRGRGAGGVIALAREGDAFAYATASHVHLERAGEVNRFALAGVRDLAFERAGRLYVATERGLWLIDERETAQPVDVSPAPGERARRLQRVVCAERWVAVATDAGVYVSLQHHETPRFAQIDGAFPAGSVRDVAIHDDALFAVVGSSLWHAELGSNGAPYAVRETPLPSRFDGEGAVSLAAGLPGDVIVLATKDVLFVGEVDRFHDQGAMAWTALRPVVPPGASIRRVGAIAGGYWLATDRGLLLSRVLAGPWRRADAPAGRAAVVEAIEVDTRLKVASSIGLVIGEAEPSGPRGRGWDAPAPLAAHTSASAPAIQAVHRVALREQGLEARVLHQAWRGVRRRAWLPTVGLSFDIDRGRSRAKERDESFVSGAYHTLHDRDQDRSLDLAGGVSLSWDLRDLVFETEQINLSREARLVIGLRDDVLDEVNQLYFERLSVASRLAAAERDAARDGEAIAARGALQLRLLELNAGIDAWTGGWFSQQLERVVPALE